jgi:5'-nucleotidase
VKSPGAGAPARRSLIVLVAAAAALLATAPAALARPTADAEANAGGKTKVQLLSLNDFHGQLEALPATATSGARIGSLTDTDPGPATNNQCVAPSCVEAGGAEYLATHIRNLEAGNPNSLFVAAGDNIGATPLLSALFHDEPTIEALNKMGMDYASVGNHEFDEGVKELLRMQYGGCHPVDGCGDGDGFRGANFQYLAANVVTRRSGVPIFPGYAIHRFGKVKVGFIGMTLEGTPLIVAPNGIKKVKFLDEVATANRYARALKRLGVQTIVVLLHEGGSVGDPLNPSTINNCNNPTGALPPIVEGMHDEIDIVITGHTNWAVNCVIDGKVVTGAASQGRLITDIDFEVSNSTQDITGPIVVNNKIITRDVPPAQDMTDLIAEYNAFAGPIAAEVVGHITAAIARAVINDGGESVMGRLIADAQLESTVSTAGGQIAFMNPGGMRADLAFTPPGPEPVTHGEAFSVQPFSNIVTTKTFTGQQIKDILEQQFVTSSNAPRTLILPVSNGFTYSWSQSAPIGSKVTNMMLNGVPIVLANSYRVTANNFLAGGGDDFPAFKVGTNEQTGLDDLVALEQYLGNHDPYTPVTGPDRITRLP